jgi:hypothetical protein
MHLLRNHLTVLIVGFHVYRIAYSVYPDKFLYNFGANAITANYLAKKPTRRNQVCDKSRASGKDQLPESCWH